MHFIFVFSRKLPFFFFFLEGAYDGVCLQCSQTHMKLSPLWCSTAFLLDIQLLIFLFEELSLLIVLLLLHLSSSHSPSFRWPHTWPSAPSLGSPNLSFLFLILQLSSPCLTSLFGQQSLPGAKCHTVLMWGLIGGDGHIDQVLDLQQKQSPLHTVDGDLRDLLSKILWVQLSAHREDASLPGLLLLQIQIQLLQGCTMIHSSVGSAGHLQDLWLCVLHPFLWRQDGIQDFFCLLCSIQNTGSWRNLDLWWLWDWTQGSRLLGANFQWPCFGDTCLRVQLTNTGCVTLEQSLQEESWQWSISLFDMHTFCTNTLHLQFNDK